MNKGLLVVISGPSGVGKSTLFEALEGLLPSIKRSVSVTTRPPRDGEEEGVHYYFRSVEEYQAMIARGELLERTEVYCNYYGTPKKPVFDMLAKGDDVVFVVDSYGAKQIKNAYPQSVLIFVFPPSVEELERRLMERGSESEDSIERRKKSAKRELQQHKDYDYFVVNDALDEAAKQIYCIIHSEKCNIRRNEDKIDEILKTF